MTGITLEVADARLQLYLQAESAVLGSQAYEIDGRKLTRADLEQIRAGIAYWSGHVDRLNPAPVTAPVRTVGRMRRGSYYGR